MRRTLISATAIAAGVLLAACGGGTTSGGNSGGSAASNAPAPAASTSASASAAAPTGYEALISGGKITNAKICDTYASILTKFITNANAQIKSGNKYVNDPYKASSYINNVAWVDTDSEERLAGLLDKAATSALNVVTDGKAGQVTDLQPYLADSMDACGLTTQLSTAKSKATAVNTLAKDLSTEADNKPWYPKGYTEYSDGLAYKWIDHAHADCFTQCWYFTMDLISRDGCPSNVYAELSLEKNGTAVDWTNDSLSHLNPGQKGRLQFITYSDQAYGAQGSITEISCY